MKVGTSKFVSTTVDGHPTIPDLIPESGCTLSRIMLLSLMLKVIMGLSSVPLRTYSNDRFSSVFEKFGTKLFQNSNKTDCSKKCF